MNAVDDSTQWRFPGGYHWVADENAILPRANLRESSASRRDELVLAPVLPAVAAEFEAYWPPANLFLIFAETAHTTDGIKNFADQYGLLGIVKPEDGAWLVGIPSAAGARSVTDAATPTRRGIRPVASGETFSAWQHHLGSMSTAVMLWSAIREAQAGNPSRLNLHVIWHSDRLVYFDSHPHLPLPPPARLMGLNPGATAGHAQVDEPELTSRTLGIIASEAINHEWLKFFRPRDCLTPARYYLQRTINQELKGCVSPKLLWNVRRGRPRDLALSFVPECLLGLLWLQLAEAVNGNRQFRQCASCKNWILISRENEGRRSSVSTCSTACRMKIYYGRKSEARRLHLQRVPVKEIARRLSAETARVQRWIRR